MRSVVMRVTAMCTAIVVALALTLTVAVAPASASTITSPGPLRQITVSPDLNCDVRHVNDAQPEWYGQTACGTLMALNGILYGPANIPAGTSAGPRTAWTTLSQTTTTGSGTPADPFTIVTVVSTGTGVTVTQTDRYVLGNEFYDTSVTIDNGSVAVQSGLVYTAGDCYLQNSDSGYGKVFGTSPACATSTQPGSRLQQLIPRTGGNTFYQAGYSSVWSRIGQQLPFPNTCLCNSYIDNGIGIAWPVQVPTGGTATFEWTTAFSPSGEVPVVLSATAHQPTSRPSEPNGYTITASNPNVDTAVLADLTVELPPGFTYTPGSATGVGEPTVSGSTLTFPGPLEIPPNAQLQFAFAVTVGTNPGVFTIDVSGTGVSVDVTGTSGAAPITVLAQADLAVTKSAPAPAVVTAGSPDAVVFTVEAINNGPGLAQNVQVIDAVPSGLVFAPGASSPGCFVSAGSVQCPVGDLAPSSTQTFQIAFTATPQASPGNRTNTAIIQGAVEGDDPVNNQASATVLVDTDVDLSVVKAPSSQVASAGGNVSFTITVSNAGPSAADYVLTDAVPPGFSAVSISGAGCTATPVPTCSSRLNPGLSAQVQVTATIAPELGAGTVLENVATVTSVQPDRDPSNNRTVAAVQVNRSADLSIVKRAPATFAPGAAIGYVLEVSNAGPSPAHDVVVSDAVPAGTTFDPLLSSPSCELSGGEVVCTLATLASGATARFDIAFQVPSDVPDGETVTNTATVTATEPDPVATNNTSTVDATSARAVDLSVTKAGPGSVLAGGEAVFEMVVANGGPSDASDVLIEDPAVPGIVWTAAEVTAGPGACSVDAGVLDCDIPALSVGESVTVTLTGTVDPAAEAGSVIENTVEVGATEPDLDENNNTASAAFTVQRDAGLDLVKTASAASVVAGTEITYTYEVFARGPSGAVDAVLTDPIPSQLQDPVVSAPSGASCTVFPGLLSCDLGDLAAGASTIVTLTATVHPETPNGFALLNTANAADAEGGQAQATSITSVERQSEVQVQKVPDQGQVVAGSAMTWDVVVTNGGPSYLTTGVALDRPDAGHTVTAMTSSDPAVMCTLETLSCSISELPPDQPVTITVTASVAADHAAGPLVNRSTVVVPGGDSVTDTGQVDVVRIAELSLSKTGSPDTVTAGQSVSYTLLVGNPAGPSTATDTVVTDTLPTGFVFEPDASTPGCTAAAEVVTCAVGTLGVGDERRLTIVATVPSEADPATATNTATAVSTEDPEGVTATAQTTIVASADLDIVKGLTTGVAGAEFSWTITVTNLGPSEADGAVITDTVDPMLQIVSVTASDGSACQIAGQDVSCPLDPVGIDDEVVVTLTVAVPPDAVPADSDFVIVDNAASVTATTVDPVPGNNTANATALITPRAHLEVSKSVEPTVAVAGTDIVYHLSVANMGPSATTAVEVIDVLDAALVFVPEASDDACEIADPATNELRCRVDALGPTESAQFTVTVRVDPGLAAGSTVINSASAVSARFDPDPQPPVSVAVAITAEADLEVAKTVDPTTIAAGGEATYSVTVTNHGPSSALEVALEDASTAAVLSGMPEPGAKAMIDCAADALDFGCSIPELRPGESYTLTFAVRTDPLAPDGTVISNTATVSSPVTDPNPDNNSSSADLTLVTSGALRIEKTPDVAAVADGGSVAWTIDVSNDGPSALTQVTVVDALPDALTITGVPAGCTFAAPRLTCTIDVLMPAETVSFVVGTAVAHGATGTVTNSAFASAAGSPTASVSGSVLVTAGTLPASGFAASDLVAWALMLVLAGCGLLLVRRREIG
ncbi:hypothetical protein AB1K54_15010 [Microbacterium sp. BWT-B31]|uniref:hypothetical protein n=1 Tax=Microbacterium sp. BWT-B31 TaxID=3232072 RepID=UPI003528B68B